MTAWLRWLPVLLCAGCAQVGPPAPEPPTLGLTPEQRFGAVPAAAAPPEAADLRWWHRFDDPALARWVERALAANMDVRLAAERVRQARALLRSVRATRGPALGADSTATLALRSTGDAGRVQRTAALALDYDLDLWGGLRAAEDAAAAELAGRAHLVQAARLAAASLAARAYVEWRLAMLDHQLLAETLALQREALRIVRVRVEAGLSPALDRERAAADLAAIEAERAEAAQRIGNAILALQVLSAEPPLLAMAEVPAARGAPAGPQARRLPALEGAAPIVQPLDLLRLRPDLRAAEAALVAAAARVGVAEAALLPRLRLPGALLFGPAGGGGFELVSATLAAALDWAVFDSGARAATLAGAASQLREAELLYRQALLDALHQVQAALLAQQTTRERIAARERAAGAARAAVAHAETLYRVGLTNFLDLADAQRVALANQRALLAARADAVAADVLAFEAMGLVEPPGPEAPGPGGPALQPLQNSKAAP